jgi:protein tyrosine phosphatase
MVSQVKRNRIMLVHCNGGKGRTGTFTFSISVLHYLPEVLYLFIS